MMSCLTASSESFPLFAADGKVNKERINARRQTEDLAAVNIGICLANEKLSIIVSLAASIDMD